jgi:MFS family permease
MMEQERSATDLSYLLKWVVITTLTLIAGLALAFPSMWTIGEATGVANGETLPAIIAGVVFGGLVGLGMGGGQAIAFGRRDISAGRWVLLSVIGGALVTAAAFGVFFTFLDPEGISEIQAALFIGSALGQGIGGGQWLALRGRIPKAARWMGITILAFTVGAVVAFSFGGEGREFLAFGLMAVVVAIITGLGAGWMFKEVRPASVSPVIFLIAAGLFSMVLVACGSTTGDSATARVRFSEPRDGASVSAPVKVVMAAENFTIEPTGDGTVHDGAGHLHIMVDTPCIVAGETIPRDDSHLHFGDGSTETELALASGTHTLCLQAADGAHTALPGDGMTHTITITVP